jgi:hypothetical protein
MKAKLDPLPTRPTEPQEQIEKILAKLIETYHNDRLESLESRCKKLEENVLDVQYTQESMEHQIDALRGYV